ncbi:hypothetical protein IRJ41_017516 [Triplophysa rosa]|uniref:Uncharacterized protein n=1 Tax=Triplophysa rosa TaxID=992332 RepID=A0A9W7TQI1_TRIRA|nr:hypothetical protein IRJ41_017516 [Triplophysa rosa]
MSLRVTNQNASLKVMPALLTLIEQNCGNLQTSAVPPYSSSVPYFIEVENVKWGLQRGQDFNSSRIVRIPHSLNISHRSWFTQSPHL